MTNHQYIDDADPLTEFVYYHGDRFRDPSGTEWAITGFSWEYKIGFIPERDGPPTREDHRHYILHNRDMEQTRLAESDLHGWEVLESDA